MKKLKAILMAFYLSAVSMIFMSCIDYVQSITYQNGNYNLYYKITFSKMLFALAEQDPESIFDDFYDDDLSDLPENVEIKKVNTDLEVGAEFTLKISPRTTDDELKKYLPTIFKSKVSIPFLIGSDISEEPKIEDENDDSTAALTKAILSSAKCRIFVGKNIVSAIETAYFEGKGSQNYSIPVFDYGNSWCLEIPLIVLFEGEMYDFSNIVLIKKLS